MESAGRFEVEAEFSSVLLESDSAETPGVNRYRSG